MHAEKNICKPLVIFSANILPCSYCYRDFNSDIKLLNTASADLIIF